MPTQCKDPVAAVYVGLVRLNEAMRTHAAQVPHLELVRVRMEGMLAAWGGGSVGDLSARNLCQRLRDGGHLTPMARSPSLFAKGEKR